MCYLVPQNSLKELCNVMVTQLYINIEKQNTMK